MPVDNELKQLIVQRLKKRFCPRCDVPLRKHRQSRGGDFYCYRHDCTFRITNYKLHEVMERADPSHLRIYKDAVWDYLIEHSDVTKGGSLFIKFHTEDRETFENRILSRWKYKYHREDPRAKEAVHESFKKEHERGKQERHERYLANIKKGRRLLFWRKLIGILKINHLRK